MLTSLAISVRIAKNVTGQKLKIPLPGEGWLEKLTVCFDVGCSHDVRVYQGSTKGLRILPDVKQMKGYAADGSLTVDGALRGENRDIDLVYHERYVNSYLTLWFDNEDVVNALNVEVILTKDEVI